jgi:hypothetical protein
VRQDKRAGTTLVVSAGRSRDGRAPAAEEVTVSDKSPHKTTAKKPGKTIKQKRAEKRAKHTAAADHDIVSQVTHR